MEQRIIGIGSLLMVMACVCSAGCGGEDCSNEGCDLTCRFGSQFQKGFESSLSCGTGTITVSNSDFDQYSRPETVAFSYQNGRSYSCSLRYDVLGNVVDVSCEGECSSCQASR